MDRMSKLAQQSMFWKMHVSSVIKQFKTKYRVLSEAII